MFRENGQTFKLSIKVKLVQFIPRLIYFGENGSQCTFSLLKRFYLRYLLENITSNFFERFFAVIYRVQNTGAQITILWGNASSSPIHCCDVTKPPYLISGELCTSPLHCLRTPCAVGAPSSASLCSEHINQTQWMAVAGDITSPTSDTIYHSCAPVVQNI